MAHRDDRISFASWSLAAHPGVTLGQLGKQSTVRAARSVTTESSSYKRGPSGFARSSLIGPSDRSVATLLSCAPATGQCHFVATLLGWRRSTVRVRRFRPKSDSQSAGERESEAPTQAKSRSPDAHADAAPASHRESLVIAFLE